MCFLRGWQTIFYLAKCSANTVQTHSSCITSVLHPLDKCCVFWGPQGVPVKPTTYYALRASRSQFLNRPWWGLNRGMCDWEANIIPLNHYKTLNLQDCTDYLHRVLKTWLLGHYSLQQRREEVACMGCVGDDSRTTLGS